MAISPGPMGSMDPQDTQPQELTERTAKNGGKGARNGRLKTVRLPFHSLVRSYFGQIHLLLDVWILCQTDLLSAQEVPRPFLAVAEPRFLGTCFGDLSA